LIAINFLASAAHGISNKDMGFRRIVSKEEELSIVNEGVLKREGCRSIALSRLSIFRG
jgi:hypothetical protein